MSGFEKLMEKLLQHIEAFIVRHKLTATTFGKLSRNNPNFVFDLRAGAQMLPSNITKLEAWMADYDAKHNKREDIL